MTVRRLSTALMAGFFAFAPLSANAQEDARSHGFAIHGDLKYGPDFTHFDYVNPDAPKGGTVTELTIGTFDSLNPFIIKGTPAGASGAIYDSLMKASRDEPNSEYGLLAEWVSVSQDERVITFGLREDARFHDGHRVRAEDVVWSFETLKEKGAPFYRYYYRSVEQVSALDPLTVEFRLGPGLNKEMPVILGQLAVLPKHYWEGRDFTATTLEAPLGSGPYRIADVDAGKSITLERVEDYWGADLPANRGHNNFGRIDDQYFRDPIVALQALKAGTIDYRAENSSKLWASAYDVPAVEAGRLIQAEFPHERVSPMQGYVFNLRRPLFQDPLLREALTYLWDFEWVNKTIMYNAYVRTDSYFDNSVLEADGQPGPMEMEMLEPLRDQLPARVFTQDYSPPSTDGSGNNREQLRTALGLLKQAGWIVENRELINAETGEQLAFEVLLRSELFVAHTQALERAVERLGGAVEIRVVDDAQYQNRMDGFDYDVAVGGWGQSHSPGNEQREYWGSESAERAGSRNIIGIQDPAIDALIDGLIASPDRETLVARTKALDRALLWGFYMIPMYHIEVDRIAYWDRFGIPENTPMQGTATDFWWIDPDKDAALEKGQ
jgi:microcin C transport system substrate-binding protein